MVEQVSLAGYSRTLAQGHGSKPHYIKRVSLNNTALTASLASASHPAHKGASSPGERLRLQIHDKSTTESNGRSTVFLSTDLVPLIIKDKQIKRLPSNEETWSLFNERVWISPE